MVNIWNSFLDTVQITILR